ncbi:MAG: glycerophosphodiester phosphodiesterase family protein [Deltaproteobacteria bacterium]
MKGFRFDGRTRPIVAAHRGASGDALENSLDAFARSADDGADLIELDVRLSADGVPVVIHDERTGRTARGNLRVSGCSADRLRSVRLKNGEPLPLLMEALEVVSGRVPVNIEVKVRGGMGAVAGVLRATGYSGELMLSSGLREECAAASSLLPGLPCGLVTGRPSASDIAFCLRHRLPSLHPDHRRLSALRIRKVLAAGLILFPYTVDDPGRFLELAEAGAAGVFTNRPETLREAWRGRSGAGS